MDHLTFAQLLGNYGEFVGAVAVIATLIYVAVQVRQAKELAVESAHATRAQGDINLLTSIVSADTYHLSMEKVTAVDGSANAYAQRLVADYGFSIAEAENMQNFCYAWMKYQEHAFLSGITSQDQKMHDAQVAAWLAYPLYGKFWNEATRAYLDFRFVNHVEELLKGSKPI